MKIHFIGIGGIGVSALAKFYLAKGHQIFGSDLNASPIINSLKNQGAEIFIGRHQAKNLKPDIDLVIYSAAVPKNNPELKEAKKRGIKCQTYSQALGDLTKKYFTIAVSGMHGKSTTTSMVALILIEAGFDPTVIVGTKLQEFGNSNFRLGKSKPRTIFRSGTSNKKITQKMVRGKYLVIEADEWNASFLNYWPKIIVLTNIEEEHLDYYRDLNHILKTFKQYIGHLPKDGVLVANSDDTNIKKIIKKSKLKIKDFTLSPSTMLGINSVEGLKLKIPGRHNLMNALAAITVARVLKIPDKISVKVLNSFSGTWRRMEYKGMVNGAKIFDDYGHHPTEIKATLNGARELLIENCKLKIENCKLWCVFQPHQYQRTYKLFEQFVNAFEQADKVVLLPIYSVAGREKESIKRKISSKMLAEAIPHQNLVRDKNQKVIYLNSFKKAANYLRKNLKRGDIAIIMGAGDIYKLTQRVIHS